MDSGEKSLITLSQGLNYPNGGKGGPYCQKLGSWGEMMNDTRQELIDRLCLDESNSDIFIRDILKSIESDAVLIEKLVHGYLRQLRNNKIIRDNIGLMGNYIKKHKIAKSKKNVFKLGGLNIDEVESRHALACASSDVFYKSKAWKQFRFKMFTKLPNECSLCYAKENLHLDHIKARSIYPELAFDQNNMQILCVDCNIGKGTTRYRSRKTITRKKQKA